MEENDLLVDHTEEARSIRNLRVSRKRGEPNTIPVRPRRTSRWATAFIWGSLTLVAIFIAAITYFAFQHTKVSITPLAHRVQFDPVITITALPLGSSTSSLSYATQSFEVSDSETVQSSGTKNVQEKAKGKITVYNNANATPVKLVANTRFESPDGVIFRAAQNVSVPAKSGSKAGSITIEVIADQAGSTGNIGPVTKFTVPGFKSNPAMFNGVYGTSDSPMSGGASGTVASVDDATLNQTVEKIKGTLSGKINAELAKFGTSSMALIDLADTDYTVDPPAITGDKALIKVTAKTKVPVLAQNDFAAAIARAVNFDTGTLSFSVVPRSDFEASHATGTLSLGFDPVVFTLKGSADLVPNLSAETIANRLVGRDSAELQRIVNELVHIKSASTKIEPFWSSSFPSDVRNIEVHLLSPEE